MLQQIILWAGALVQWLWEKTHVLKVVGSNPGAIYWMDMTFFTLICCKNCIACLKRPKINEKEAGDGPLYQKAKQIATRTRVQHSFGKLDCESALWKSSLSCTVLLAKIKILPQGFSEALSLSFGQNVVLGLQQCDQIWRNFATLEIF